MSDRRATCRFRDLCIDVTDLAVMTRFWAASLGLRVAEERAATVRLDGALDQHRVWLNAVPESRSVKNRMHLDLWTSTTEELIARGAHVLDADRFRWDVLSDPEGGEFCAFTSQPGVVPAYRVKELAVDAADPMAAASWWARRFQTSWHHHRDDDDEHCWIEAAADLPWNITFAAVPEPKRTKNRIHLDVVGNSSALLSAGATLIAAGGSDRVWDVLADPEGNEFCVFPA